MVDFALQMMNFVAEVVIVYRDGLTTNHTDKCKSGEVSIENH